MESVKPEYSRLKNSSILLISSLEIFINHQKHRKFDGDRETANSG